MSVAFSTLKQDLVVKLNADASYSWSGQFNNATVRRAIPITDGRYCVLLLDPDASTRSVFANLLCIDRRKAPTWTAKVPTYPDVFVEIRMTSEGLEATSWSGFNLLLDPQTGEELKRTFVK